MLEINPKTRTPGKTYRFRNSRILDENQRPTWTDISAPSPKDALEYLGWKDEDIDIAKVWKCSGKIGESGLTTSGGWGKLNLELPAAGKTAKNEATKSKSKAVEPAMNTIPPRETACQKRRRLQHEEFDRIWQENKAKGLTGQGFTKAYDGQSIDLYINNKKMMCKVDYELSCPHLEFRGEPCLITETGYRSHFMQCDLKDFGSLKEAVEDAVEFIIRNRYCQNSKAKYTLTWEPSIDYLKHSPEQLTLFDDKELAKC